MSTTGSSPSAASTRAARVSQRASRSCTECKRRKIRCDKTVPCSQCLKAKAPHRCHVETVELTTKYTKSRQEIEFLHELRDSLSAASLEEAHELITRRLTLLETGQEPVNLGMPKRQAHDREGLKEYKDVLPDEEDDIEISKDMSLMRIGRGYPDKAGNGGRASIDKIFIDEDTLGCLPEQSFMTTLVTYYLKHLSWHHPVLHSLRFLCEYTTFCQDSSIPSRQWPALLFAILSAAAWNYPARHCVSAEMVEDLRESGRFYYRTMILVLERHNYTLDHDIHSLQAIIISCMTAHPYGQSVRQMVLVSAAIRIAQCLELSSLPPNPGFNKPNPQMLAFENQVDHQLGCRIWWQLLVQDYFLVPMAGSYCVSPYHFTTPLPINCADEDMVVQPDSVPTINSYSICLAKMAILMPQLVDGLRAPTPKSRDARYKVIQTLDAKMTACIQSMPAFLQYNTAIQPDWPVWVPWARSSFIISAADKLIMIHRSFLGKSFIDPKAYPQTRITCVNAAVRILTHFLEIKDLDVVRLWTIPTFTVAGAAVLALDIVHRFKHHEPVICEHEVLLQNALSALREMGRDENVAKGVRKIELMLETRVAQMETRDERLNDVFGMMTAPQWDVQSVSSPSETARSPVPPPGSFGAPMSEEFLDKIIKSENPM